MLGPDSQMPHLLAPTPTPSRRPRARATTPRRGPSAPTTPRAQRGVGPVTPSATPTARRTAAGAGASTTDHDASVSRSTVGWLNSIRLASFEHAPHWVKDNHFIIRGYRAGGSWADTLSSLFHFHNETVNIWTHLVAALCMLVVLAVTIATLSPYGVDRLHALRQQVFPDHPTPPPHLAAFVAPRAVSNAVCPWFGSEFYAHVALATAPIAHNPHVCGLDGPHRKVGAGVGTDTVASTTTSSSKQNDSERLPYWQERAEPHSEPTVAFTSRLHEGKSMYDGLLAHAPSLEQMTQSLKTLTAQLASTGAAAKENTQHALHETVVLLEGSIQRWKHALANVCYTCAGSVEQLETLRQTILSQVDHATDALTHIRHDVVEGAHAILADLTKSLGNVGSGISFLKFISPHQDAAIVEYLAVWPIVIFIISAFICLSCSAAYHLVLSVSENVGKMFQRLDYGGITILILGSNVPVIYYGFYCEPYLMKFYLTFTTALCSAGFLVSILERFTGQGWHGFRAALFIAMGVSGAVPAIHMVILAGHMMDILVSLVLMGSLYISGALFYAFRFPERCSPGQFDMCGASHQLFHCFVILGVITHYVGVIQFYEWRIMTHCPA